MVIDSPYSRFGLFAFGLCFAAGLFWAFIAGEPMFGPPGNMGDDVYFENIGWQLFRGRGISFDFTDKDWQKPYVEENDEGNNDWILNLKFVGVTTSRSPGLPFLIAAIYSVAGRDFLLVRLATLFLMSAACGWLLQRVAKDFGWLAATFGLTTLLLDGFIWRTAGQFMSEGPGVAVTVALCGMVWLLAGQPADRSWNARFGWLGAGLLFGVGILIRANLNAWLLLIVSGLAFVLAARLLAGQPCRKLFFAALFFGIGVAVVAIPWWARNCVVTGGFAPSGTSGSFGLVGGYCDAAFADFGNWSIDDSVESQERSLMRPGIRGLSLAQQEYQMGLDSTAAAKAWARENASKLPQLVLMKMVSHLGFYRQPLPLQLINGLILVGAVLGCWSARRSLGGWIALVVLLSLVTTGLTWSHYGRYSIPLRPLLHISCGLGTVYLWSSIFRWLRSRNVSRSGD